MTAPNPVPENSSITRFPPNFPSGVASDAYLDYFKSLDAAAVRSLRAPSGEEGIDGELETWETGRTVVTTPTGFTLSAPPSGTAVDVLADLASTDAGKGDELIAVQQPFTGSVPTTQHAVNTRVYHAHDFGASVLLNDNAPKIQAALDACAAAGGGIVFLGPGTYKKESNFSVPQYTTLRGAGMRSTKIENTVTNITGVTMGVYPPGPLLYRHGGLEDMHIAGKSGDTTNIGVSFDATNGYAHGRFRNLLISGFNYSVNGGDLIWECEFDNVRCDLPLSRGFRFVGVTGTTTDNLLKKCYVNNVGGGASTGKSFEFDAAMSKSVMLNCTFGDTSSIENQLQIGTNVKGLAIIGGNAEGFTPSDGNAAVDVYSSSIVSINGLAFQFINKPASGINALIHASGNAQVTVTSCAQLSNPGGAGTQYSMRVSGTETAKILHSGCSFVSPVDTVEPIAGSGAGTNIININGHKTVTTTSEIDLSSVPAITQVVTYVDTPSRRGRLVRASLLYIVGGGGAGKVIDLGFPGYTNFLGTVTTNSTAQWSTQSFTINDTRLGWAGGPVIATVAGGATATGKVLICLTYTITE